MAVGTVLSVNVGRATDIGARGGPTGIDKRPVTGRVGVTAPGDGAGGLAGDSICDTTDHGGPDQALYAIERLELDHWGRQVGRPLPDGTLGENLTLAGIDTTAAVVGSRWSIGSDLVVEVTLPRVPCATLAVWMGTAGFLKDFTVRARPGAYLRVVRPGTVAAGDPVVAVSVPDHPVTVGTVFRAITREPLLLPSLAAAGPHLTPRLRELVATRTGLVVDDVSR